MSICKVTVAINNDNDNIIEYSSLESIPHYNSVFITHLSISNGNLQNFTYYLPNLKYFKCSGCKLVSISYYPNLETLDISNNQVTELPSNLTSLKTLVCIKNKLPVIPDYPNLEELYTNNNLLENIGEYPKLKYLSCKRNNLKKIGKYPLLETLYCEFNQISVIYDRYPNLQNLRCHYNKLTNIPYFERLVELYCQNNNISVIHRYPNLLSLYCSYNVISEIPEMPTIKYLVCDHNRLTKLPNLVEWPSLVEVQYLGNEIVYIPPNITRFLNNLRLRRTNRNHMKVYDDSQNVHNHQIQESIRESTKLIIQDKPQIDSDIMFQEIVTSTMLTEECKKALIEFSQDKEVHCALGITFAELLLSVWSIIRTHHHSQEICTVLNTEMTDSICKCFTGRMSRLINCLNGFDERVKVEMPLNEQIANVIILIEKQLNETDKYTVELHKELVTKELLSRGFSLDEINLWVEHIE